MAKSEPKKIEDASYEPLISLADEDSSEKDATAFSLEDLIPHDPYARTGIFTRALKYINFAAKDSV